MKKSKIKRLTLSLAVILTAAVFLPSCKHETEFEKLNQVSYSAAVAPIISANCAYSGCHGDSLPQKFNLLTYEGLMSSGVEAGKPKSSKLYKSLVSLNSEDLMPQKPYEPLTDKQIQLIYVWIGQGAKNN